MYDMVKNNDKVIMDEDLRKFSGPARGCCPKITMKNFACKMVNV
jgi:hypothetical protein